MLIAALACATTSAGSEEVGVLRRMIAEEPHMGVIVRIDAYLPVDINPAHVFRAAFNRVAALEQTFSSYRADSEVRRVEEQAWREPLPISAELSAVLGHALAVASASGGAFDPTLGSMTSLLRPNGTLQAPSDKAAIAKARNLTGWQRVEHDAGARKVFLLRRGLQLDFGGIAKGYIADETLRVLERAGVERAMVSVAGDIATGEAPPGQPGWRVGLDATGIRGGIERHLVLRRQAVSTSGSRERFYETDGRRCSHILGRSEDPCVDAVHAVSVVAPTGMEADALATALVAMGPEAGTRLLKGMPGVRAYWARAAATTTSPGRPSDAPPRAIAAPQR